jgi:hypothetical protein
MKPLRIDAVSWDKETQEFVVELSVRPGVTIGGSLAGFMVSTSIEIDTGGPVFQIDPKGDPVSGVDPKDGGVSQVDPKDTGMYLPIDPQRISWDRGTYKGTAIVTVTTALKNPSGEVMGVDPEPFMQTLKIDAKGEEPPTPEPNGDGK